MSKFARNNDKAFIMATKLSPFWGLHEKTMLPFKKKMPIKRVVITLSITCLAAISIIWLHVKIETLSNKIKGYDQKRNTLQSANRYMRMQFEKSISYEDIYSIVQSKFGMDLQSSEPIILEVPDNLLSKNHNK